MTQMASFQPPCIHAREVGRRQRQSSLHQGCGRQRNSGMPLKGAPAVRGVAGSGGVVGSGGLDDSGGVAGCGGRTS